MKLYELVGRDESQGFSPFVWRIRMALAHKGLKAELVPLHFTQIADGLHFADSKTVPVLVDGDNIIKDSWDIACYLEAAYPDKPSIFGGSTAKAQARLLNSQIIKSLLVPFFKAVVADIYELLDDKDQQYFRASREPRLGCTLGETIDARPETLKIIKENLWPYNQCLKDQHYFGGDHPAYSDYILYGTFQWVRATSKIQFLEEDETLYKWRQNMDELFGGLGKSLKSRQ